MLTESEQRFEKTGRYHGVERLTMQVEDPIRYEKIFSRLRGGMVNARETALNISASPIVKEIGELCFALYTPEGDSITLSTGIMVHVHTMSDAIKTSSATTLRTTPGLRPATSSVTTTRSSATCTTLTCRTSSRCSGRAS
jgi:hypothetical protein